MLEKSALKKMGPLLSILCVILVAVSTNTALAFIPQLSLTSLSSRRCGVSSKKAPQQQHHVIQLSAIKTDATTNPVEITFPTPDDAASMGIRDWPQQFHSSTWTDTVSEGSIATRYVLDGKGRLTIDYYDDNGEMQRIKNQRVYPGTLVEVDGEANLLWEVDDEKEGMVILTPGYEEGGKLLLVGGILALFCAGLLVGAGGL